MPPLLTSKLQPSLTHSANVLVFFYWGLMLLEKKSCSSCHHPFQTGDGRPKESPSTPHPNCPEGLLWGAGWREGRKEGRLELHSL